MLLGFTFTPTALLSELYSVYSCCECLSGKLCRVAISQSFHVVSDCCSCRVTVGLQGYQAVYARLGVRLEERGESFYNSMLPGLVQMLMDQSIAEESEGAKVVFVKVDC